MRVPDIELTERENELLFQIAFRHTSHDELRASLAPMAALTESLLERGAIPNVRFYTSSIPSEIQGGEENPVNRFSKGTALGRQKSLLIRIF